MKAYIINMVDGSKVYAEFDDESDLGLFVKGGFYKLHRLNEGRRYSIRPSKRSKEELIVLNHQHIVSVVNYVEELQTKG